MARSKPSPAAELITALEKLNGLRMAVVGIGNRLNGDDAIGPMVAQGLIERQKKIEKAEGLSESPLSRSHLLVIDAGPSPESFSGPLRRFAPQVVIMVDAAELGEPPGSIQVFDWADAEGLSASTHTLPPSVLAQFLVRELNCRVLLVGIQPKSVEFDQGVSNEARLAVRRVVRAFACG